MTEEEFYADYFEGRKDFTNSDLKGIDFFTPIIRRTHPEFFDRKLSDLVLEADPVIHKPIEGVEFRELDLSNVSIMDAKLLRVNMILASLKGIDSRFASFLGASFSDCDFTGSDLRFAIFTGATIKSTSFYEAKLDHAVFDLTYIENSDFTECSAISAKIDRTAILRSCFNRIDFTTSSINQSKVYKCVLDNCKLERSKLKSSTFLRCSFENCDLSGSEIVGANFNNCSSVSSDYSFSRIEKTSISDSSYKSDIFSDSNISRDKIKNTKFEGVGFLGSYLQDILIEDSTFIQTVFGKTSFIDMDLSFILGKYSRHSSPSSIDHKSIIKTIMLEDFDYFEIDAHQELRDFMELCGIAPIVAVYFIDSIRACSKNQLREIMSSTFISYGSPDENFAKKLNSDLTKYGVNTFFFH